MPRAHDPAGIEQLLRAHELLQALCMEAAKIYKLKEEIDRWCQSWPTHQPEVPPWEKLMLRVVACAEKMRELAQRQQLDRVAIWNVYQEIIDIKAPWVGLNTTQDEEGNVITHDEPLFREVMAALRAVLARTPSQARPKQVRR